MKFQHSKWQAAISIVVALAFMALSGLALFARRSLIDDFAVVFFGIVALYAIWLCRKMFDVVVLNGEDVVQRHLGTEARLAWSAVTGVQLRDIKTVLIGEDETRISVDRNHPAYSALTRLVLERFATFVVRDAGTTFHLSRLWATGFFVAGSVCLGSGGWLIQGFGMDFWPGWATMGLGLLFVIMVTTMPRRLVIRGDEIEVGSWRGPQVIGRSEVAETRMVRLPGSIHVLVEIVRKSGHRIPVQLMHPGQFRLWLALEAWKRG